MSWNAERVEKLKTLWASGLSASQVARAIGETTRNAVIGKVHRLGLARRAAPQRREKPASLRVQNTPRPAPKPALKPETLPPPESKKLTLLELSERCCRFPIGDPKDQTFRFCGAKTEQNGEVYCAYHQNQAYQGRLTSQAPLPRRASSRA